MTKQLREYQIEAKERVRNGIRQGNETGVVHFFTGGGKSVTAIEINKDIMPLTTGRSLMIAPARSLIFQMAQNYQQQWPELRAGVMMNASHYPGLGVVMEKYNQPNARIIIGSAQTLVDRNIEDKEPIEKSDIVIDRRGNVVKSGNSKRRVLISERFDQILMNGGLPGLIQLDECHHSVADGTLAMMMRVQQLAKAADLAPVNIVGYTATPVRNDGRGLFNLFKTIYITRSYRWAQREGYLVPFSQPVRVQIDNGGDALTFKNISNWVEITVKTFKEKSPDRHVMGFTGKMGEIGGVEASETITRAFIDAGIPAAHTDGMKCIDQYGVVRPLSYRGEIYKDFMAGKIKALWAFGVGMEGLDLPIADCLYWMRPTDNDVMKTQAVGRILRLHPGKEDALIVEFTGHDITLNPLGNLFGYKVDPFTEEYVFVDEEDDEILDGVNIKDVRKKGEVLGTGVTYKIAEIISKQSSDWYRDEDSDTLTMSVSDAHSLLISPPNYTKADLCNAAARDIVDILNEVENPYKQNKFQQQDYDRYTNFETMTKDKLKEWEELLQWVLTVYSNFTMWSVVLDKGKYKIQGQTFINYNSSLDTLLLDSVEYIATVDEREQNFTDRKMSWKRRDKATQRQRVKLKELGYKEHDDETLKEEYEFNYKLYDNSTCIRFLSISY